jgi:hypothetical protein
VVRRVAAGFRRPGLRRPARASREGLESTVPLGDGETLERLRQRTQGAVTRPVGSAALVDASVPSDRPPETGQEPGSDVSGS